MSQTNISYTGKVDIKIKGQKPVRVYNSGSNTLFELISAFLGNSFTNLIEMQKRLPAYIDIVDNKPSSDDYDPTDSVLLNLLSVNSREGSYPLVLSAVLSGDNLSSNIHLDNQATGYALLLTTNRKILAYVPIALEIINSMKSDDQAIIDWTLTFTNT